MGIIPSVAGFCRWGWHRERAVNGNGVFDKCHVPVVDICQTTERGRQTVGKRETVSVAEVRVGDRLLGKGRGVVSAIKWSDVQGGKYFFDYAMERDRTTAPWESFYPSETVEKGDRL